jgi:hypothetical protein
VFYRNIVINWTKIKPKILTTKDQITNECLWLNSLITSNGRALYSKININNNLNTISNIVNNNGTFKSLEQINHEFNINLNFLEYLRIRQCIPHDWKQILDGRTQEDNSTVLLHNKLKRYNTLKCSTIYWLTLPLKHDMKTLPNSHLYWLERYNLDSISKHLEMLFTCIRITFMQAL